MTHPLSRRLFIAGLGAALSTPALVTKGLAKAPESSLRPVLRGADFHKKAVAPAQDLIAKARLGGRVSFAVADTRTGLMLEQSNGRIGLPPASVAKAMTVAYALHHLGPGHHFTTQVLATGPVVDGVLQGDLVLVGGGDPTLDTESLGDLAIALKATGLSQVRGRFLVWGGALPFVPQIDSSQPAQVGYNPSVSGLNLNFNRVHFEWRRQGADWDITMQARSLNYRPPVRVAQMNIVTRDMPVFTYSDLKGRDQWTVARGTLGRDGARWLPVRKPELYCGEVFQVLMAGQGLRLGAPEVIATRPAGQVLAMHRSAPLRIILRDMLRYSTNLTAEVVGLAATTKSTGKPADLRASARVMSAWSAARFGLKQVAFVDHSGLGDASRISASDMARALVQLHGQSGLKALLRDIPLRDGSDFKVRAKTGTLNFVSGLAGYVDAPDGSELAFAVFAADTPRRDALTRAERERPRGAKGWNTQARALQLDLLARWSVLYGT